MARRAAALRSSLQLPSWRRWRSSWRPAASTPTAGAATHRWASALPSARQTCHATGCRICCCSPCCGQPAGGQAEGLTADLRVVVLAVLEVQVTRAAAAIQQTLPLPPGLTLQGSRSHAGRQRLPAGPRCAARAGWRALGQERGCAARGGGLPQACPQAHWLRCAALLDAAWFSQPCAAAA